MRRKSGNEESSRREKEVENKTQHNTTQHNTKRTEITTVERKKAALHLSHPSAREYARLFSFADKLVICERLSKAPWAPWLQAGARGRGRRGLFSVFLFAMMLAASQARLSNERKGKAPG
jgi:hypothetical protein